MTTTTLSRTLAGTVLAACLSVSVPSPADAAFVITVLEQSSSVVINGSGTVNTTGLTRGPDAFGAVGILQPYGGELWQALGTRSTWTGLTGPNNFGNGGSIATMAHGGDNVGIQGDFGTLILPEVYTSGTYLEMDLVYALETFESLGLTQGTYVWNWSGDSLTVQIGERPGPIPEPTSALLLGVGLLGVAALRRRNA